MRAQEARYELGRRLHDLEVAWDAADVDDKLRALPALKESVTLFFGLRLKDAAGALDRAHLALVAKSSDGVEAWCRSFVVRPAWRFAATGVEELVVSCERYYDLATAEPQGGSVAVELLDKAGAVIAGPVERSLNSTEGVTFALPLAEVRAGDHQLRARFVVEDRERHVVTLGVSLAEDPAARLEAIEEALDDTPRPYDLERSTAQRLHGMLERLLAGKVLEMDVRAAALLREAEAALAAEAQRYDYRHEGDQWLLVPVEGGRRAVRLYAPPLPDDAANRPCVIALHGAGGSDNLFFEGYGHGAAVRLAKERGWLLVAPQAPLFGGGGDLGPVIVVLDDIGPPQVAEAPTPVLDLIAATGRVYPVAWAAPSCSAARAAITTGRWAFRPENRMGSNVREHGIFELVPSPKFLPARVTAAGQTATHLGKWHMGIGFHLDHPNDCGYSHAAGTEGNLSWSGGWSYFTWVKVIDGAVAPKTGYVTTDTINDAIAEVQAGTDLIVVSLHAPHAPKHCPPLELAPIDQCADIHISMLEAADTEIGRLLGPVLANNYTMFITADNGRSAPVGGKWTVYESGLQVPAYAVGYGVTPGVSSHRLSILDFAPTALDLLQIPYESDYFDGVSLATEIGGATIPPRYLYSEIFPSGTPFALSHRRAIRDDRWKLHTAHGWPPEEFYDLQNDPDETTNLLDGRLTIEQEQALQALRDNLPF